MLNNPEFFSDMFSKFAGSMQEMEEKQKNTIYKAQSGGGLVKISINGKGEVIDLNIDKSLLDDVDSLQILLMSAINEVYKNMEKNKINAALEMVNGLSSK